MQERPTQRELAEKAAALKAQTAPADESYLPARKVWERYGVTDMSLHRWVRDPRMQFPPPTYFGRLRFWRLTDLVAWERSRAIGKPAA